MPLSDWPEVVPGPSPLSTSAVAAADVMNYDAYAAVLQTKSCKQLSVDWCGSISQPVVQVSPDAALDKPATQPCLDNACKHGWHAMGMRLVTLPNFTAQQRSA